MDFGVWLGFFLPGVAVQLFIFVCTAELPQRRKNILQKNFEWKWAFLLQLCQDNSSLYKRVLAFLTGLPASSWHLLWPGNHQSVTRHCTTCM